MIKKRYISFLLATVSALLPLRSQADTYPLPDVPSTLTEPVDRADYVVEHFWEKAVDLGDPSYVFEKERVHQSFVDFLSILPLAHPESRKKGIDNLMEKASGDEFSLMLIYELAEKYLYNVDSPMKDEETYILFLNDILRSKTLDTFSRTRPSMQLEAAMKNRVNTAASDFEFTGRDGKKQHLSDFKTSPNLILIFYDPDCEHCRDEMALIAENDEINHKVDQGIVKIVAIYSGEDKNLWDATKNSLPEKWIVGYNNGSLQEKDIYIIRTFPTIYKLDEGLKVNAKEISAKQLLELK